MVEHLNMKLCCPVTIASPNYGNNLFDFEGIKSYE